MDHIQNETKLPNLYGALVIVFPTDAPSEDILDAFQEQIPYTRYPYCVEFVYREVPSLYRWEINDLLTHLFSICDLDVVKRISNQFCGRVFIDISFHHYEIYPALVFEGKNMEIIRSLQADIGIDPY